MRLEAGAALNRAVGQSMIREGDRFDGLHELVDAAGMEAAAAAFLDPRNPENNYIPATLAPGNGGEMVLQKPDEVSDAPRLVDTVRQSPDVLAAHASRTWLELASKAGVLELGVDLAETIKARNSFEKMISAALAPDREHHAGARLCRTGVAGCTVAHQLARGRPRVSSGLRG